VKEKRFKEIIWDYYKKSGRHDLPWRKTHDPYRILVSEVMLQQTQVSRVLKKYEEFLKKFPSIRALAKAPQVDVLRVWQGLGYNRRALLLKRTAETIVSNFGGTFPKTSEELESLPGIGQSTRGALMAFAFSRPTVFIETNIRSVFIHFFFKDGKKVSDKDVLPLIEKTLDQENPREWYYALMDYGLYLKQTMLNPSRKSAHHIRQSPFKGSNREVRAKILRFVISKAKNGAKKLDIIEHIGDTKHDVAKNIDKLTKEGFMRETRGTYSAY